MSFRNLYFESLLAKTLLKDTLSWINFSTLGSCLCVTILVNYILYLHSPAHISPNNISLLQLPDQPVSGKAKSSPKTLLTLEVIWQPREIIHLYIYHYTPVNNTFDVPEDNMETLLNVGNWISMSRLISSNTFSSSSTTEVPRPLIILVNWSSDTLGDSNVSTLTSTLNRSLMTAVNLIAVSESPPCCEKLLSKWNHSNNKGSNSAYAKKQLFNFIVTYINQQGFVYNRWAIIIWRDFLKL